jgi:hypothetical protein
LIRIGELGRKKSRGNGIKQKYRTHWLLLKNSNSALDRETDGATAKYTCFKEIYKYSSGLNGQQRSLMLVLTFRKKFRSKEA